MIKLFNINSNLLFRARLLVIAAFSVAYIVFLVYLSGSSLLANQTTSSENYTQITLKATQVARVFSEIDRIISIEKQELNQAFNSNPNEKFKPRRINYAVLERELANLKKHISTEEEELLHTSIKKLINDLKTLHLRINNLIFKKELKRAAQLDFYQLEKARKDLRTKLLDVLSGSESQLYDTQTKNRKDVTNKFIWIIISSIIYLIVISIFILNLIKELRNGTQQTTKYLTELNTGIVPIEELPTNYNELGVLNNYINALGQYHKRIRKNISSLIKDEDIIFQMVSENDKIGQLLADLKAKNNEILARQSQSVETHEYSEWVFNGIKLFNDILTKLAPSIEVLADKVILALVEYLKLPLAGFYAMHEDDNGSYLKLVATYAFDKRKLYNKRVEIGEGLVGASVIEKHISFHSNIPDDYFQISSGMGQAKPNKLMIIPLIHTDTVVGVIELATFTDFEKRYLDFLEQITPNIAVTVSTVEANERNYKLLTNSEKKINILEKQNSSLESQIEALKIESNNLQSSVEELGRLSKAVDAHTIVVELSDKGEILSFNSKFVEICKFPEVSLKKSKFHRFIKNIDEITLFHEGKPTQKKGLQRVVLTNQSLDAIPILGSLTWSTIYHNRVFFIGIEFGEYDTNLKKVYDASRKLKHELELATRELQLLRSEKEITQSVESVNKQIVQGLDPILAYAKFSKDWDLLDYNNTFIKQTQLKENSLKQLNLKDIIPSDFVERLSLLENSFRAGNIHRSVVPLQFENSTEDRWFEIEFVPILSLKKRLDHLFLNFRDLDEVHRREQLLENRHHRIVKMHGEITKLKKEIEQIKSESISRKEVADQIEEHNKTQQQLKESKEEKTLIEAKNLFLKEDKTKLNKTIKEQKHELEKQHDKIHATQQQLEALNQSLKEKQKKEEDLQTELEAIQKQYTLTQNRLSETEQEVERYKRDVSLPRAESSDKLKKWINDLKRFLK